MENLFEDLVDILIGVIILFLFPLLYFGLRQDTITQQVISARTTEFVDTVRTQGLLTQNMYDAYLEYLDDTNLIYDIHLEHKELAIEPEYRLKTAEEVIDEQNGAWNGPNVYTYTPVTTEIPNVTDPVNNSGNMYTETNESILASAVDGASNPSHVHTEDCYAGTKHAHSAYGGSCYTYYDNRVWVSHTHTSSCYHSHTSSCYTSQRCGGSVSAHSSDSGYYYCSSCKFNVIVISYSMICGKCGTWFSHSAYRTCQHGGAPSSYSCSQSSSVLTCSTSTTQSVCGQSGYYSGSVGYNLTCGKTAGLYYNGSTQVTASCSQFVANITPTHPIQTIYLNDPIITTATVTHLDGSTKIVACSTAFTTSSIVQNKTVTLTYNVTIYGTVYTKTLNIIISVIPKTKTCVNGHIYNLNIDGSDPGCIFCSSWLRSLVVAIPNTGRITIYKGSTLETNGVVLLAIYLNGRTELIYSGYANNLDTNYVGTQTVTISYKGKYTSLIVTTNRNLVRCGVCGKYYELYPDGSDPGCPYCAASIPVFTGNVLKYYAKTYSNKILEELYEGSGTYYFKTGDYFSINASNRNETLGNKLLGITFAKFSLASIKVTCGGDIRDVKLE